jgi:hypothetical protein
LAKGLTADSIGEEKGFFKFSHAKTSLCLMPLPLAASLKSEKKIGKLRKRVTSDQNEKLRCCQNSSLGPLMRSMILKYGNLEHMSADAQSQTYPYDCRSRNHMLVAFHLMPSAQQDERISA